MAEVFGVVAGAIQLADVALRVSREVYGFLAAVKDADKDIRALRDALRDVESNVRSLRRYVAEFQKSKCAIEEFEVLSEAITRSFGGFHDDILALKQILPPKPTPSLAEKTKWTYKQRRIKEITGKLRDRKVDLTTALSITGRIHDLRVREDAATIMREQALSTSAIGKQAENIEKSTKANEKNHAELLEKTRQISTQLGTLRNDSQISHLRRRRQAQDIRVIKKSLRTISKLDPTCPKSTISEPDPVPSQHAHQPGKSTTSVNPNYDAAVSEIHSTTTFTASHTDLAARIIRNELRSNLGSMIEQAHITSETRYEAITQKIDALIEQITSGCSQGEFANESTSSNTQSENGKLDHDMCDEQQLLQHKDLGLTLKEHGVHTMTSIYRQTWYRRWRIGNLSIQITRTTRRLDASPIAKSDLTIYVQFWPDQTFMPLPGVALLHSTAPNQEGFYQLAPMINIIPIVPWSDRLHRAFYDDNLTQLRHMLATGELHLRSQDQLGNTLLHVRNLSLFQKARDELFKIYFDFHCFQYTKNGLKATRNVASLYASVEISQFLVTEGFSWNQTTCIGGTPIDYAIITFFVCVSPSKNRISYLQFATSWNEDIDKLCRRHEEAMYFDINDLARPENLYTQLCEYMVQNSNDGWYYCCNGLQDIWSSPTRQGLSLIGSMLDMGLKPDQELGFSIDWSWTLLMIAQERVRKIKQGVTHTYKTTVHPTSTEDSNNFMNPWCIITALIKGGAKTYHIIPNYLDKSNSWLDLVSLSNLADMWDIRYEWEMALGECGLDSDDVLLENIWQRRQAFRLRGVNRTGFDDTILELPSFSGLRCRRCCRKVCRRDESHWNYSHENRLYGWLKSIP